MHQGDPERDLGLYGGTDVETWVVVHSDCLIHHGHLLDLQCLNGSQLLVNFGLSPVAPLTPRQFALLCPALLYQIDSRVCIKTPAPAPPGDVLSGQWMRSGVVPASW